MSQIVTWEYYSSLFEQVLEKDFRRVEYQAEKAVCAIIGPIRWAVITEETYGYEQLKDCICNTMNKLVKQETSGTGKGISSASNDGYSESYVVQTESQARAELNNSIRAWLAGTGLVGAY